MKKSIIIIGAALLLPLAASAQSLNIRLAGAATYNFGATDYSEASFESRNITVADHSFGLDSVALIYVDDTVLANNNVVVKYTDNAAEVIVAGNLLNYVSADIAGADVVITQSDAVSDTECGEITYTLCGNSGNGSFKMLGAYKASFVLDGLQLSSQSGAALNFDNGKRIALKSNEGTVNVLADCAGGSQKGAIVCKGHLEFKGKGSLQVTGNSSHAIYSKEYVELKNTALTVTDAVKDGINCAQYFAMESGTLTIAQSGDDGIQVSYKDAVNREAEDTGSITIKGGTLNITTKTKAAKSLKAENDITVSGGKLTLEVTGNGVWDAAKLKTKAAACIGADGNVLINGGELHLTASGSGGKGISCDGQLTVDDGSIWIKTTGGMYAYVNGVENHNYTGNTDNINSDYKSSPKGIKADGDIYINGGIIDIATSGNGAEGIEAKATITIGGGTLNIKSYDDGINSTNDMVINGGSVCVVSTAGDGLDSNANLTIAGGSVQAYAAKSPEMGLDAATENGCAVIFTGGSILAVGGGNSGPTTSATTQAFISLTNTVTAGTEITIKDGDAIMTTFTVPAYYGTTDTPLSAPAFGPGGGTRPGAQGGLLLSAPGMESGKTYSVTIGSIAATATAKLR